jgi:hypothetical protein
VYQCVIWVGHFSNFIDKVVFYHLCCAIFIDSLVVRVKLANVGCCISLICCSIFLYAYDISIVLAPSMLALQILVDICEKVLILMIERS